MSKIKEGRYAKAEISDQTEAEMTFTIDNPVTNEFREIVKPTLNEAKAAAAQYLTLIDELQGEINNFEELLQEQENIRNGMFSDVDTKSEEYIANRRRIREFVSSANGESIPQQLYSATFNFQQIINNLLEQYVEVVFVYAKNGVPDLYTVNEEKILKYDYSSSNHLTARYYVSNRNYASALQKLEMNDLDETGLSNLKTTYQECVSRYNKSRVNRVMWLNSTPPPKWQVMKVSALGDINEAYAAVVLTHQEKSFLDANIENNIDTFMIKYVGEVDNISGLLQGDVEVGNIEYAIKSSKASTLGLQQVRDLAKKMMAEDFNEDSLKELQKEYQSKGGPRDKTEEGILDDSVETLDDALATYQQLFGKVEMQLKA